MARMLGAGLAGLTLLAIAAPAHADQAVDFESPSLGNCTTATTQYAGVRFVSATPEPVDSVPLPSVIGPGRNGSAKAIQTGECSDEFPYPQLAFQVTQTRAGVTLYARSPEMAASPSVQLRAYDTANTRIDTNGGTYTTLTGGGAFVQLSAVTPDDTNRIATVVLVTQNPNLLQGYRIQVDDINLVDSATEPPPSPDFSLGPAPRATVTQGSAATVRVPVNRFNGSAGEMDYEVTGMPPGTSASDFPYADDLPEVTFHISSYEVPPGDYSPVLTATPRSAAQGPGPRSTVLPLTITEYAPSLTIEDPAEGVRLDREPYGPWVRGRFQSLRDGDSEVCAVVTRTAETPPAPSYCRGTVRGRSGEWEFFVEGVRTGDNFIHAFIRDRAGKVGTVSRLLQVTDETSGVDIRLTGVELTQGVQRTSDGLHTIDRTGLTSMRYRGVQLVRHRNLWVRVFGNTSAHATSAGTTPDVTARLRVFRNGSEVATSPFMPTPSRQNLDRDFTRYASYADRADYNKGWRFTVPASLFRDGGTFAFEAEVNDSTNPIVECAGCRGNNTLRVTDAVFRPMQTREIWPMRFTYDVGSGRMDTPETPGPIFAATRRVTPFPLVVHPWIGSADISRELNEAMAAGERAEGRVIHYPGDYERDRNPTNGPAIGVANGGYAGLTRIAPFCCEPLRIDEFAVVTTTRPLTSVAHEWGHTERLPHADHACGGDSDGQEADDDWPESRGLLLGVGYEPDLSRTLPAYDPVTGGPLSYDYMSYCAGDDNSALSTRFWDRLIERRNAGAARAASAASLGRMSQSAGAQGPALAVSATTALDGSGASIADVQPVDGGAVGSAPGGDMELVVLDAAGNPLSRTTVASEVVHTPVPGPAFRIITTTVPAGADPRALQLVQNGVVVATRTASPNAPTVRLLAPRRGARVRRSLVVRWQGSDADGDRLRYAVDFAPGPRSRFRVVAAGLTGSSATIPLSALDPSRSARIRVRALDGFRHGTAVVTGVRVPTAPPSVEILEPAARQSVPADAAVPLSGEAFDARSRLLRGRALVWSVDGRRVGTGPLQAVTGLRPGRRRITLTATALGRRASRTVTLRVTRVTPRLLSTGAPARVSRRARALTLRLSASVPSAVRITGGARPVRAALGRRARRVRVRLRPGARPLGLTFRLRGGGRTATERVVIPRA